MLGTRGADPYRSLLVLAEGCVAAGVTLFFDDGMAALQGQTDLHSRPAALLMTVAVTVMAAATVSVGGFAPGRVAAAFLVLLAAHGGKEVGGSIAGCVLGGAMALTATGQAPLAVALAVGGLAAGLFAHMGRWCQAGLFLLTAAVYVAWRRFYAIRAVAGWLLVPYLAWCLFALYLNIGYVVLN